MTLKIMYRILMPMIVLFAFACSNNDQQRTVDALKDSTSATQGGVGGIDSTKHADTGAATSSSKTTAPIKDSSITKKVDNAVAKADEKTKAVVKDVASATKKAAHKIDSTVAAKKDELTATKKESAPSTDEKLLPASAADNSKAFAPKYGLIPRDANENNITSFKNAFPDKQTLVKINFDAEPDAEMEATKVQIIKAMKKAGYINVSEKSTIFHPTRMPKDIHYELQRDGSVIIWLQPASAQ